MSDKSPTVFLLDDDETVLAGLSRILQGNGFSTRSWTSPEEFLQKHDAETPGCLVADLYMPAMSGLAVQRTLLAGDIGRPIIFVTAHLEDIPSTVLGMKAGAVTFLTKPVKAEELIAAVHEAFTRDAKERVRRSEQANIRGRLATLTLREREVLDLVSMGMANKTIAARLGAAEGTIKVYRWRLLHKMRARNATVLARLLARIKSQAPPSA